MVDDDAATMMMRIIVIDGRGPSSRGRRVLGDRTPEYPRPRVRIVTGGRRPRRRPRAGSRTPPTGARPRGRRGGLVVGGGFGARRAGGVPRAASSVDYAAEPVRRDSGCPRLSLRSCRSVASNLDLGRGRGRVRRRGELVPPRRRAGRGITDRPGLARAPEAGGDLQQRIALVLVQALEEALPGDTIVPEGGPLADMIAPAE